MQILNVLSLLALFGHGFGLYLDPKLQAIQDKLNRRDVPCDPNNMTPGVVSPQELLPQLLQLKGYIE